MGDLITCPCNHCSGFLEFDSDAVGQAVPCPHCGLETTLFHPPESTQSTPNPDPISPGGDPGGSGHRTPPPCTSPPGTLIRDPNLRLCATCGSVVPYYKTTPGSIWIEILLWLCFLIPGVLYSIWRLTARHALCPACNNRELLPLDTPRAAALAGQLHVDINRFVQYRPPSVAWQWAKALLIAGSIIAIVALWNLARENERVIRDAEAAVDRTWRPAGN